MREVLGKNRTPITRYNGLSSLRFPSAQGIEKFTAYLKACEILESTTMTITVGSDTTQPGKILPTFRRNLLLPYVFTLKDGFSTFRPTVGNL
jgi:hypothetical protein